MQSNSPLELVHELFKKLGARYIIVTDTEGLCTFFGMFYIWVLTDVIDKGVIDKKAWLAFVGKLEENA